ncbi:MAG: transglycosylase SLT domain-containing protein [Pseudomonadota bacterium]
MVAFLVAAIFFLDSGCALPAQSTGPGGYSRAEYVLPPDIRGKTLTYGDVKIPIERKDVAERVVEQINYLLMDRRATMMGWFDRTAVYGPLIQGVLKDEKMPPDLVYLAALLSDFMPNAVTRSGGVGWWTLGALKEKQAPAVAKWVSNNDWDDRRDPVLSTRIVSGIFQWLLGRKETSNFLIAVCAYVDGTEPVEAAVKKAPGYLYWDMVMPTTSEAMIPRLVALKIIDQNRKFYGVYNDAPPPLAFDVLDRLKPAKDLPLHVVADWCRTVPRSMWELNPGVDPAGAALPKPDPKNPAGYSLRVPKGYGIKVRPLLIKEGYLTE